MDDILNDILDERKDQNQNPSHKVKSRIYEFEDPIIPRKKP